MVIFHSFLYVPYGSVTSPGHGTCPIKSSMICLWQNGDFPVPYMFLGCSTHLKSTSLLPAWGRKCWCISIHLMRRYWWLWLSSRTATLSIPDQHKKMLEPSFKELLYWITSSNHPISMSLRYFTLTMPRNSHCFLCRSTCYIYSTHPSALPESVCFAHTHSQAMPRCFAKSDEFT